VIEDAYFFKGVYMSESEAKLFWIDQDSFLRVSKNSQKELESIIENFHFKDCGHFQEYLRGNPSVAYTNGVIIGQGPSMVALISDLSKKFPELFLRSIIIIENINPQAVNLLQSLQLAIFCTQDDFNKKAWTLINSSLDFSKSKIIDYMNYLNAIVKFSTLTPKEVRVLILMLSGKTNVDISNELHNSSRTIEIHRASIFDKMNIKNAIELSMKLISK